VKLKQSEDDVIREIQTYLRTHGWRVHRLEADRYRAKKRIFNEEPGTPDLIAVWQQRILSNGKEVDCFRDFLYIEAKRPGGKLRTSQRIWIEDARKRGWPVIVCDSLESLKEQL
jgi:hypothetical protein